MLNTVNREGQTEIERGVGWRDIQTDTGGKRLVVDIQHLTHNQLRETDREGKT